MTRVARLMPGKRLAIAGLAVFSLAAVVLIAIDRADRAYPPPLDAAGELSTEAVDRDGLLLRAFTTPQGIWRLPVRIENVDPDYINMLIAYEDRRFRSHFGVDPVAMARAFIQLLTNGGRIVSGGSTITMQLARLIEPREQRTVLAKIRQMVRALQIERRLSKDEILALYLTLAPYGGNLEGVRAASLAWFGREPAKLTLAEAALLVALPQSPEARRPDRNPKAAEIARNRVLGRMQRAGLIPESEIARASRVPVSAGRRPMPDLAAHSAERARALRPKGQKLTLTLMRGVQARLEELASETASRLPPKLSLAMVLADGKTGEIVATVGSTGYHDAGRSGAIDMTQAVRSPGSTLKPFIYGLAFEDAIADPETLIDDTPADFAGYRPRNFDRGYMGEVSLREALQMSLNVPAVRLLEAVGPQRLLSRLKRGGVGLDLPPGGAPGLAIGLGGAGISLRDLVQLYTAFTNQGRAQALSDGTVSATRTPFPHPVVDDKASWRIGEILSGVAPPQGAPRIPVAYKTGTSYGYRDAWAVGFDGRHVLGVWVGRPDAAPVPGISGIATAAPLLFDGFVRAGLRTAAFAPRPEGLVVRTRGELPFALRRFGPLSEPGLAHSARETAPKIVYPPEGARVVLRERNSGGLSPLVIKLQGGAGPYRLIANGTPVKRPSRRKTINWTPDGAGASTLTVMDGQGRAASVNVFIDADGF
ncbi:MAG: penicillin-binding protein 1C [Hoeflea sp.]|uniref:penicillin-binding protein 1C n=1 Tax=Hoeflea sp. TaxID=1940281 RepID=UPI0032F0456D